MSRQQLKKVLPLRLFVKMGMLQPSIAQSDSTHRKWTAILTS